MLLSLSLKITFIMENIKYVQKWRKWHKECPQTHYPHSATITHGQSCFICLPTHFSPMPPVLILKQTPDIISFHMHIFCLFKKDKDPYKYNHHTIYYPTLKIDSDSLVSYMQPVFQFLCLIVVL